MGAGSIAANNWAVDFASAKQLTPPPAPTNRSAESSLPSSRETENVAKPELGAKRQCQSCGTKFFDLNRDPIVCPKCGTVFQGAVVRAERVSAKDEEADEEAVAPAGVEIVSLDEVEASEEKAAEVVVDEIDVDDDGPEDDAFLEEEEEDEDDVTALIDGEIAPDEEG